MEFNFFPVGLDTETTGIDFIDSQVIQVGAVFCDEKCKPIESYEWNINFQEDSNFVWTEGAERVHKISLDTAKKHGIEPSEFILEFDETIKQIYGNSIHPKDLRIVGAQSYFDYIMMELSIYKKFGNGSKFPVSHRVLDINGIGSFAFGCDSFGKNMEHFGIDSDKDKWIQYYD